MLQDLRNVLQLNLRQKIVINCVERRLLQNGATLVTKCASYYKIPQPLLQNVQVIEWRRRSRSLSLGGSNGCRSYNAVRQFHERFTAFTANHGLIT